METDCLLLSCFQWFSTGMEQQLSSFASSTCLQVTGSLAYLWGKKKGHSGAQLKDCLQFNGVLSSFQSLKLYFHIARTHDSSFRRQHPHSDLTLEDDGCAEVICMEARQVNFRFVELSHIQATGLIWKQIFHEAYQQIGFTIIDQTAVSLTIFPTV